MVQKTSFVSDGYRLEGVLERTDGERGVVIAHPHPLYGGNMHNSVVGTLSRVYHEKGFTTLRFNFRGVGASQGQYDHGNGEITDALAAVNHLKEIGLVDIEVAGYSFGAYIWGRAAMERGCTASMVMISPPLAFMDFSGIQPCADLRLIIVGQEDEIAPLVAVREWISTARHRIRMETVPRADHFFSGRLAALEAALRGCLS
ncbi:MAG: alpha/beta hydrolase [Thermodesulfobacteriota bacterium]